MSTTTELSPRHDATAALHAAAPVTTATNGKYTDIVIAVHGIGAQQRNSTVRSVANRLAQSHSLLGNSGIEPLAPQPLGYFHTPVKDMTYVSALDNFSNAGVKLASVGFTEVFWADIPQEVVKEGRTIEETKAWARTVVARAEKLCAQARAHASGAEIVPPDFTLAAEVLSEIIDAVHVLENLAWIGERAGVGKFDLREVLDEYLGDVQIVTEFAQYRTNIVGRFEKAMQDVADKYPTARLHIVAHSEGTVVSFLGLLNAIGRRQKPFDPDKCDAAQTCRFRADEAKPLSAPAPATARHNWLKNVAGYMTIGSPIDKHLLLWPELFQSADLEHAGTDFNPGQIKWRNYYDYGDPVGFRLDTARLWLREKRCHLFEFRDNRDDYGFARYLFPGKAHNDYWCDAAVFEHFVQEVIDGKEGAVPPQTRKVTKILSPLIPYVLSFVLLFVGTFLLYETVSRFMNPAADSVQSYIRMMVVGDFVPAPFGSATLLKHALGVTLLVCGVTLLARWPRIVRGKRWWIAGAAAFAVGCFAYAALLPPESRNAIGAVFLSRKARYCVGMAIAPAAAVLSLIFIHRHRQTRPGLANLSSGLLALGVVVIEVYLLYAQVFGGSIISVISHSVVPLAFYPTYALLLAALTVPWWKRKITPDKTAPHMQPGKETLRAWLIILTAGLFLAGCVLYNLPAIHKVVDPLFQAWHQPATLGTLMAAFLVSAIGMTALIRPVKTLSRNAPDPADRVTRWKRRAALACNLDASRRTRWFSKRMRPLIVCGAVVIVAVVAFQMLSAPQPLNAKQRTKIHDDYLKWATSQPALAGQTVDPAAANAEADKRVSDIENMVRLHPRLWPVVLAGAGFLYLWWLAALIFDLAFVWQVYIRRSLTNNRLHEWRSHAGFTTG